jgi:antirestriction protein ArdC
VKGLNTMTEKMTPESATSFDRYSMINAVIVKHERKCECEPYEDIYTYARWQAQGYQVRKGEHGTRITTFIPVKDKATDKVIGSRPWSSVVFCRCQVDKVIKQ